MVNLGLSLTNFLACSIDSHGLMQIELCNLVFQHSFKPTWSALASKVLPRRVRGAVAGGRLFPSVGGEEAYSSLTVPEYSTA
jgi:hypothetical protein